jgi:hypothetical protein
MALPFEPTSVLTTPTGLIALWKRPPVAYTRVKGHLSRDNAQELLKLVESAMTPTQAVEEFHDWSEMSSYDTAAQMDLTLWTVKMRKQIKSLTIVARHPIVTMGIRVANVTLKGMIQLCESVDDFETRLTERLKHAA